MWTQGKEIKVFEIKNLKFSTPICFEDTFGDICRKMRMNGAECFFNLSTTCFNKSYCPSKKVEKFLSIISLYSFTALK